MRTYNELKELELTEMSKEESKEYFRNKLMECKDQIATDSVFFVMAFAGYYAEDYKEILNNLLTTCAASKNMMPYYMAIDKYYR